MGTGKESLKTSSTSLPHSSIQCTFSITKSKTLVKSIAVHKCSSPVIWYLQSLDSVFLSNLKFHWKQSEQFIIHIYKTFAFTQDGLTSTATNEILGPRDIPWCCTFRSVWGKVKIMWWLWIGCIWLWPATILFIIILIILGQSPGLKVSWSMAKPPLLAFPSNTNRNVFLMSTATWVQPD